MREEYKDLLHSLVGRRIVGVRFGAAPGDVSFDLTLDDGTTLELYFDGPESGWYVEGKGGPMAPDEEERPIAEDDDDKPMFPL